jgi:hypothetical protein
MLAAGPILVIFGPADGRAVALNFCRSNGSNIVADTFKKEKVTDPFGNKLMRKLKIITIIELCLLFNTN